MAKYIGLLTSDARGKLGGVVMSRARGATTLKSHTMPKGGASLAQQTQRVIMSAAITAWRALTASQQQTWIVYASTQVWTNSLGTTYSPTGLQLFTQAYINARAFNAYPPATVPTGTIAPPPIINFYLEPAGISSVVVVNVGLGTYTNPWLCWISRVIPSSLNYTKTLPRAFMGYATVGNFITVGDAYITRYGKYPQNDLYYCVSVLPVEATTYISGTRNTQNVQAIL